MKKIIIKGIIALIVINSILTITASAEIYLGKMADYGMKNACSIFSTVNCLNTVTSDQVSLEEAIAVAKTTVNYKKGTGLTLLQAEEFAKALAPEGVKVVRKDLDIDTMLCFLEKGYTIAVPVDSNSLWKGTAFHNEDHLIAVLGLTEEGGEVSLSIVDSGMGLETLTVEQLESCTRDIFTGISFKLTEC